MNTSLAHLPEHKQEQVHRIIEIIKQVADPEKIILFGSHATGNWVEDITVKDNITYEYISDYDILVVTKKDNELKDYEIESHVENKFDLHTPVNIVAHNMEHINRMLEQNRYFFADIQKEGILLYDAGNETFAQPRELTPQEKKAIALEDYEIWFKSALSFLEITEGRLEKKDLKIGAFQLHQAAERTYNAVLLVYTGYKPRTHSLSKLYRYTKRFSKELALVFPQNSKEERHLFDLLKRGYIDARYSKTYTISETELATLIERVRTLQSIADALCKEQITAYDAS